MNCVHAGSRAPGGRNPYQGGNASLKPGDWICEVCENNLCEDKNSTQCQIWGEVECDHCSALLGLAVDEPGRLNEGRRVLLGNVDLGPGDRVFYFTTAGSKS